MKHRNGHLPRCQEFTGWCRRTETRQPRQQKEFKFYKNQNLSGKLSKKRKQALAQAVTDGDPGIVLDGSEYKITGAAISNVYAQGAPNAHGNFTFDVGYEITDPSTDGTLPATSERTNSTHTLEIEAVTDPATLVINSITADTASTTITGTTGVEAVENTALTVNVTLSKDPDANGNNEIRNLSFQNKVIRGDISFIYNFKEYDGDNDYYYHNDYCYNDNYKYYYL